MRRVISRALLAASLCAVLEAQTAVTGAGRWEGSIKTPTQDVPITVDLSRGADRKWSGAASMPSQGARDIPLSGIEVNGDTVRFSLFEAQAGPLFEGKLSPDGQSLSGKLSSSGESAALELKRTGEAVINTPPASTQLGKEFEGKWEGALEPPGQKLRVELTLKRQPDGSGSGVVKSPDQKSPDIPISTVTQEGRSLKLEVRAIGASYAGTLSDDGRQITGQWTQGAGSLPLVLKRP